MYNKITNIPEDKYADKTLMPTLTLFNLTVLIRVVTLICVIVINQVVTYKLAIIFVI